MMPPDYRPSVAARETEQGGEGAGAVDALARVLDPDAFEPSEHPRNIGWELQRADRKRTAVAHAVRALAAGYRLVSEEADCD
jgi:hypothetical protein